MNQNNVHHYQILKHFPFNGDVYYQVIDTSKSPSPAKLLKRNEIEDQNLIALYWQKINKISINQPKQKTNENNDDVIYIGIKQPQKSDQNTPKTNETIKETPKTPEKATKNPTQITFPLTPKPQPIKITPNIENVFGTPQPKIQITQKSSTQSKNSHESQNFKIQQISVNSQFRSKEKTSQNVAKSESQNKKEQTNAPNIQILPITLSNQPQNTNSSKNSNQSTTAQKESKPIHKESGKTNIHELYSQMQQKQQKTAEKAEQYTMALHKRIILDTDEQETFFMNFKENVDEQHEEKIKASVSRRHAKDESPYLIITTQTPLNNSNDHMEENLIVFEKLLRETSPNFVKKYIQTEEAPFNA